MSSALFTKYAEVTVIGVTGTRGKSTVTHLIHEILVNNFKDSDTEVHLGGNVKGISTLALFDKVKRGDYVVLELDSWQLQGFGEDKISPHVAVFTTFMPDHMIYYKNDINLYLEDKTNIFKYQTENDFLILGEQVSALIDEKYDGIIKSKKIVAKNTDVPSDLKILIPGEHNINNISIAIQASKALNISDVVIKRVIESFKGVPSRLEFLGERANIKIYNDTNATSPEATVAGLKALSKDKNIVLIMGGQDKGLDMSELIKEISNHCNRIVILPGTGTDRVYDSIVSTKVPVVKANDLAEAFGSALASATSDDIVLLSPAFASFGLFKNEYDRGDQFNVLAKKWLNQSL